MAEIRGLVDTAAAAGRDLADNENSRFTVLKGEVRSLDTQIEQAETLEDMERRSSAPAQIDTGLAGLESRFSVAKALQEYAERGQLSGIEAEWAAEHRSGRKGAFSVPTSAFLETRAGLSTTTPTAGPGSNLIQTFQQPISDRIRPRLAIEQLGATVLSNLVGQVDLPRLKASGPAKWVAEGAPLDAGEPAFAKSTLIPRTAAARYGVTRRMLLQAAPALETILRNDLALLLTEALDKAAIAGAGGDEPSGLLAAGSGIKVLPGAENGGALTLAATADLIGAVPDGAPGERGFLGNAKTRTAAMKMLDDVKRPLGLQTVFHNEAAIWSDSVPSNLTKGTGTGLSALIYGAWADLVLGYWGAIDILADPYADAASGGLVLHAFLDCDVAVRQPEAFAALKDVVTA